MTTKKMPKALELGSSIQLARKQREEVLYTDCFFCFLDILGYKNTIFKKGSDAPFFLRNVLVDIMELGSGLYASLRFKILSDSVLIWTTDDEPVQFWNLVNAVDMIKHQFFKNHVLVRGGISHGLNYVDEDIIVSPALVEAYQLEQLANYPRIVVSEQAFEKGNSTAFEQDSRFYIPLNDKYFRKVDKHRILSCVDGRKILAPLYITVPIYFLKHGVFVDSMPGDSELTEAQKAALEVAGRKDLIEYAQILKAIQVNGKGVSKVQDKVAFLVIHFNNLVRAVKFDELLIDPVRLD